MVTSFPKSLVGTFRSGGQPHSDRRWQGQATPGSSTNMRLDTQRHADVAVAMRSPPQLPSLNCSADPLPAGRIVGPEDGASPSHSIPPHLLDHCTRMTRSAHSIPVPHVQQRHNWDCGLACVLMALQMFGITSYDLHGLQELCCTKSIWTIDLAHLLRFFGMDVTFLTITIGANPEYASESFYREHIEEDEQRVARLFRAAPSKGVQLHQCSLNAQQLQAIVLSGVFIPILLVDKRKLTPARPLPALCGASVGSYPARGYTGHYIVICGLDAVTQEYAICDPAAAASRTTVSSAAMEAARQSFGTDEDILLVSRESYHCCGAPVQLWKEDRCRCGGSEQKRVV
eukprot:jgi/Tetstr1/445870/TSEL_033509.t1